MSTVAVELDKDVIYLNHAAVAPWPVCTREAVKRFAEENSRVGSRHYARWVQVEQRLRSKLQTLLHAESTDEIALLKSTSEALSVVAYGLDWMPGDQVVIPDQEFPSNRIVWESLGAFGVEVVPVDLQSAATPEQALIDACTDATRLMSVSSVQYASGLALELDVLGAACRQREILFCIDAIQSLGAKPFDVRACQADFVAADGHKWMLGPEGLAVFFCRRAHLQRLRLNQYGWHMVEAVGDYDRRDWLPAPTARRFECGSPNMLGIHALDASLGLLLDEGIDAVYENISNKITYLIDILKNSYKIATPVETERRAGIVTFMPPNPDETLPRFQLLQDAGVVCALRGGGIRFSPHFHTRTEALDRALELCLSAL
jgi:selenocysteine lyase/cysteine desulfurase